MPTHRITGILNGQRGITGDPALRLGHYFGTSPELWLSLQTMYELGVAERKLKKSTAEKDRACRTLCAFADGQGGRVLFGITPAWKVVGQTVSDRTLEELAQEFQGFEPRCFQWSSG